MEILAYVVVAAMAYLLGSLPTGYLVARAKGIDIRAVGSGNIGATNAFRVLGKGPGSFVLLVDALKGVLAVMFLGLGGPLIAGTPAELAEAAAARFQVLAGIGAILGHNYTCWLGFKGGKGIATSAGVFLTLIPWALLAVLAAWILVFAVSRYVSLASIIAAAVLPVAAWLAPLPTWQRDNRTLLLVVTCALAALAIYKHKGNIQRLLAGTENRIGRKAPEGRP